MWSGQGGEATVPPAALDSRREISAEWRNLNQSKTALRHIENRLEAVAGSGVVINTEKTPVNRSHKASHRERRGVDDPAFFKPRRSQNPEKSSRSPLRNSTQDNSTERLHTHTSQREAPPADTRCVSELCVSAAPATLSAMVYELDSRPVQTADLDSTHSSALDNTTVRILNDPPVPRSADPEFRPSATQTEAATGSASSSPGSASVRLEKLRQRRTDGKLEKLKERIRRQREQLEESAERDRITNHLEQPVGIGASVSPNMPIAKVRKVAPAPRAPIYKGFNTSETKIRTPDGRVWGEEEFLNYSREIYTHHLRDGVKQKEKEKEKEKTQEKKTTKPVRKICRSASVPDPQTRPVISTSSWREGQKLVKMILGPSLQLPSKPRAQSADRDRRTAVSSRSSSDPRMERNRPSRPHSSEGQAAKTSRQASGDRGRETAVKDTSRPAGANRGQQSAAKELSRPAVSDRGRSSSTDLLSADIRGILDDLQLESEAKGPEEGRVSRRSTGQSSRAPIRSSRSVSPTKTRTEKKRQYDAEAVRQYIARQQEDRKRKQVEERRSQREVEQKRNQRLQELYRRQRETLTKPQAPSTISTHTRLQDTYTKLLLEHTLQQPRPVYQPSGESDKENKRQEPPSPSHSDLSVSEYGSPAMSRAELGVCSVPNTTSLEPSAGNLFSQLLVIEGTAVSQPVDLSATHTISAHPGIMNPVETCAPVTQSSRLSRVEALKASAASLSSRIEREALKLAGCGINYGMDCSRNAVTGPPDVPQDENVHWIKPLSPPIREGPGSANEPSLRIQRLLRAGQNAFGGDQTELPGVGNLYNFGSRERSAYMTKPSPSTNGLALPFTERVEPLESSGGSISEGLLTDSSLSEVEDHPGDPTGVPQDLPKPSVKLAGSDYCATLQNGHTHDPITLFQREAEQLTPYRLGATLQDSRPPWDDLAKGSPHSVINIFTKNMHNHSKVVDVGGGKAVLYGAGSASNSLNGLTYEDDFISSHNSSQSLSKRTAASLSNGHNSAGSSERRGHEKSPKSSTPLSSPHSTHSTSKRGSVRTLERPLVDGQRSASFTVSELQWNGVKKSNSPNGSPRGSHRSADTDSTAGGHSFHSMASEGQPSPRSPAVSAGSPVTSPRVSPPSGNSNSEARCCSSSPRPSSIRDPGPNTAPEAESAPEHGTSRAECRSGGPAELQFAPGVLQQRLNAELSYLDAVEESVRQLSDVERIRAVSLAQQESVSLAQILKAQQQRQERELQLLKLKSEQEALETQRQLQESRERATEAHTDLCMNLVQSQQQALLGLQESSSRIISQQTETAQHTAAAARHIREITELARSQMLNVSSVTPLYNQQRRSQTDSSRSEVPPGSELPVPAETPTDSLSESIPSRRPTISGGGSSARLSPSLSLSLKEQGDGDCREHSNSSVEEEVHTAAEESLQTDSIRSLLEDRADSASIATEYSLKFDESVTEDELEKSFRSLLPSESHWRDSVEQNRSPLPESDEERSREKSSSQLSNKQDSSIPFSSGQDSFSKFTMAMVKQYMQEEEVRAQHQSSLLRLRQRAVKEKTKAELAWLEHQKKRLRDKGDDDKMPPIRKKQRGLLLKLQQEQAEIRRLQEANRAARRERQLLLKQQEEIERIRHSTLKLKEKLRSAGDNSPRSPVSGEVKENEPSLVTDAETRSPSPLSVSGSETSSIMQKLKKMRYHMDERFLTEREQRLVRRRLQAEELLQWRQRLDAEEAAVRQMEKQALAAWEQQPQRKHSANAVILQSNNSTTYRQDRSADREVVREDDTSAVSSVHSAVWVSEQVASPSSDGPASKQPSTQTSSSPKTHTNTAQQSESTRSLETPPTIYSSNSKVAEHSCRSSEPRPSAPTSEAASDQSDIEGRVLALKEELRRRKAEVQRLKKAQKQRNKERLKAQEASLLKQLESYNTFIEKTKAELSKEADSTPAAKPQIKTPASGVENKLRIRAPAIQSRPDTEKNLRTFGKFEEAILTESVIESAGHSELIENHEVISSDEDPPTVTTTPVFGSPERMGLGLQSSEHHLSQNESATKLQFNVSADQSVVSSQKSEVLEDLDCLKSEGSGDNHDLSNSSQHSHPVLKLDLQLPSRRAKDFENEGKTALSGESSHQVKESPQSGDSLNRMEDIMSSSSLLNKPLVTEKAEAVPEKSPSPMDGSYTPDFSSRKEDLDDHKETLPSADGYNDDFESSLVSSFREDNKGSDPTSPSALRLKEKSYNSSFASSEEEVDEELSVKSGITSGSFHPERPLDLDSVVKPSKNDFSDDVANSPTSPTTLPSRSATSPHRDEMPSYCIGDRVLVSNIQPGTLRFKGQTSFANGFWAGVELDKSEGSNDGTYDGVVYFQCKKGHGIFAPPDRVTLLPDRFESYVDTTEDEDSSFDDQSNKMLERDSSQVMSEQNTQQNKKSDTDCHLKLREPSEKTSDFEPRKDSFVNSELDLNGISCDIITNINGEKFPVSNRGSKDIILEFEDVSNVNGTLPTVQDKGMLDVPEEEQTVDILDLLVSGERFSVGDLQKSTGFSSKMTSVDRVVGEHVKESRPLNVLADKLLNSFMNDAVQQFQEIKKAKEKKIRAANQQKDVFLNEDEEFVENNLSQFKSSTRTDDLQTFFDKEQEEVSSPELCNRSESPVLGPSGQEELAKRLAELELSRELLDALGDEQDWFDEDFGLSSRKEQEKLKQRQEEGSVSGSPQGKAPARPQLPQPKPPEEPAMLVPHTTPEVEKLVSAALLEIWKYCSLDQGQQSLTAVQKPQPSEAFLNGHSRNDEQEAECIRSYKQAVFDLSWEVVQDIFMEDPNADQPQWVKPRRTSASIHRINGPSDLSKVQAFVTNEVLKLYSLKKDQNNKTDWQKMLKFGRKKRDRVDHILVQELHEEEALWVNYDEDELFVKMQLADGIFDALLKDTAEILIQIQEKRSKHIKF